ncbi:MULTISPECIES: NHLP bacteriocin export ABC transporter permease/ATPase subunit [Streptomyces]|uniref:NHLP bacteriocin export ABC transporter permease/ATPase subunit n=1 Tax=Streptomyces TaxID=1883 RepID=UPI001E29A9F8|nr:MULTISPECIES: NHLP bacteriocin export ABC transporter permease/ATPase subunit [Streptomyces]UFQ20424.1 NHLP bacteriocin export ABC transporter permease/ATPase subunit [Streptomyces huasconensis]WCL90032.1 NHLP bacteriocin export ABC transporter permease/ATPase subunit [Streptomyces sp. JCM 35825]
MHTYDTHTQGPVAASFGALGTPVDCAGLRSVHLEGPQVLWLVVAGALDLFAVDAAQQGHWHYLGRLEPGALLLGPVEGPRHTLVGRPLAGCALRRVPLRELYRPDLGAPWPHEQQYPTHYDTQDTALSLLEHAFALGIGRGHRVLFEAPLDGRTMGDEVATDDDILWMPVAPGSVQYGAAYSAEAAGDLLVDAALWQRMVNQQHRLLAALDRWIERLERAHEDRAAAGIKAGESVREQADRTLIASIGRTRGGAARRTGSRGGDDATYAACRLVAEAAGITLADPADGGAVSERIDPVERIAVASRVRTRAVRLDGRWWRENAGPLVGHRAASGAPVALLWRRGGYEAVHPTSGRRTRVGKSNADEFEPHGVMFYRPLPDRPLTPWRLFRFSLRGTRGDVRNLALAGLVTVVIGALVPIATGQVLGVLVPNGEKSLIAQVSLALMITSVVSAAFMLLQNLTVLRMEGRMESTLQPAVWDRLLRLPTRFFAARSTGELASAAMGVSAIRRVLSGIGPVALQAGTVGAMNLALLLFYSVPLALAALAMLAVIAAVFLALGLAELRWQRRLVELGNKLNNQAFQTLRGLPKLRVAGAESFAYAAWAGEFARSRELQRRAGRVKNATTVLNSVYLPLCTLVMFVLLAGPARGSLTAGEFLTFSTAVTMLLTSVTQLTGALISAAAVLPMFEQIKPVLDEAPEVRAGSTQPGELQGAIEARGLSFRYTDDGPLVLDDVSLTIRPGEFVAVVGPSGCGKSTLLRLLIGFDEPLTGSVLYDGQDLAALDQAAVRRQCGVVLQNALPLTGSILECICGAESYTQEEAWEAAAMAGLAEDIKRMPMGLHTMISGGGAVSGGQRQRLMIAQALIRRPRVLFFDEATSALDNETQRTVIDSTRALNATRVVIAHRLSTVMDADRVLVMSEGRVVEQGPPAQLLADPDGRLRELVRRQMR